MASRGREAGAEGSRLGSSVRWRRNRSDPRLVHLVLYDQRTPPGDAQVAAWVEQVRTEAPDAVRLRSGAMYPPAAAILAANGFGVHESLRLLQRSLTGTDAVADAASSAASTRVDRRTWRLPRRRDDDAAQVDGRAFRGVGDTYDLDDIAEVRHATARHRARRVKVDGQTVAYAISGIAGTDGFLQRLAVDPDHRHRGHGMTLVLDALDWMRHHGAGRALVNTGIHNDAALALYDAAGFRTTPTTLQVMELDLRATAGAAPR